MPVEIDDEPLIGGTRTPSHMKRRVARVEISGRDQYEKYILRILMLHPDLKLGFRSEDLNGLDVETKKQMVKDIESVLGIEKNHAITSND